MDAVRIIRIIQMGNLLCRRRRKFCISSVEISEGETMRVTGNYETSYKEGFCGMVGMFLIIRVRGSEIQDSDQVEFTFSEYSHCTSRLLLQREPNLKVMA